jgi:hypothetical protein
VDRFAYGEQGIKDVIPPNSELTFDLEVLGVGIEVASKYRLEAEMAATQKAGAASGEGAPTGTGTSDNGAATSGDSETPADQAAMKEQIMKMLRDQYGDNVNVDIGAPTKEVVDEPAETKVDEDRDEL